MTITKQDIDDFILYHQDRISTLKFAKAYSFNINDAVIDTRGAAILEQRTNEDVIPFISYDRRHLIQHKKVKTTDQSYHHPAFSIEIKILYTSMVRDNNIRQMALGKTLNQEVDQMIEALRSKMTYQVYRYPINWFLSNGFSSNVIVFSSREKRPNYLRRRKSN